jgi:hypothetical protein
MRECHGRNWQIFDLNIIAHFLAKRIFDKSANFEKYSLFNRGLAESLILVIHFDEF